MSCDEAVIRELNPDDRVQYGMTLLQFAARPTAAVLGFAESSTKSRIHNILNYKKPAFWVLIAGLLIAAFLAVPLLSNPRFGADQRQLDRLLKEAAELNTEEIQMTASLPDVFQDYQCRILPLSNRRQIIVLLEKAGQTEAELLYNLQKNTLDSAAVLVSSPVMTKTLCTQAAATAADFYKSEKLFRQAVKTMEASPDLIEKIENCRMFDDFDPFTLRLAGLENDEFYIELGAQYQLLYDRKADQIYMKSAALVQTGLSDQRLKEIVEQLLKLHDQNAIRLNACILETEDQLLCPSETALIPEAVTFIYPLVHPEIVNAEAMDYEIYGLSIKETSGSDEVLAAAAGVVEKVGVNEKLGYYVIINHEFRRTFYGRLSDEFWLSAGQEVQQGQVIGYLQQPTKENQEPLLHFAVLENNQAAGDSEAYLMAKINRGRHIHVPERLNYSFVIHEKEFKEIIGLVRNSQAYAEYQPDFKPYADHNYGNRITDVQITAQVNDFPTMYITQQPDTHIIYLNRAYLFSRTVTNLANGVDADLTVTISADQDPSWQAYDAEGKPVTFSVYASVSLSNGLYGSIDYDPSSRSMIQQEATMTLMDADEETREALKDELDKLIGIAGRTDEKALALAEQIIPILTQGQNAVVDLTPLSAYCE